MSGVMATRSSSMACRQPSTKFTLEFHHQESRIPNRFPVEWMKMDEPVQLENRARNIQKSHLTSSGNPSRHRHLPRQEANVQQQACHQHSRNHRGLCGGEVSGENGAKGQQGKPQQDRHAIPPAVHAEAADEEGKSPNPVGMHEAPTRDMPCPPRTNADEGNHHEAQ